jgi:hypothetical protein
LRVNPVKGRKDVLVDEEGRSMRMTKMLGLMLALGLGALPINAQEVDGRLARIRAQLPEAAVQQIEAQIAQAREQGLPVEPLLDKAVEGIAKQVPGDRIVGAVGSLAVELGQARALLADGEPPAADVSAVADALRRGVPESAVQRIAGSAGEDEPVALAVHTLGDLMDRGVPVDQAVTVLEVWRARGAQVGELRQLPAAVERLIRQGVLPEQAAAAVAGAMRGATPNAMGDAEGKGQGPPIPPGSGPPSGKGKGAPGGGGSGG